MFKELNATDRCDQCPAQAQSQVLVSEDLPSIILCCHHLRKSFDTIIKNNYRYTTTDDCDWWLALQEEPEQEVATV